METQKSPDSLNKCKKEKQSWKCHNPNFNYTAKLQQSKEYETGTKTDTQINGTE